MRTGACFYVVNLVLLSIWPAYTEFWAQFAYVAAGVNAISWTAWATAADWGRLVLVAGLGFSTAWLAGKWANRRNALAADADGVITGRSGVCVKLGLQYGLAV